MQVNNEDLRLTILGCFRYSLGRMTYMPSHTFAMFKNCQEVFKKYDWEKLIQEIDEQNEEYSLGMDCDKDTWFKLKEFAKDKLYLKEGVKDENN